MSLSAAAGSPTLTDSAAAFAISATSAMRFAGTSIRVGALHDWPELRKHSFTPSVTAFVQSTSSSRMFADLPPSSWPTRLTVGAARIATSMPAPVEPVKDMQSMPGCSAIAWPTTLSPWTRLNTPAGTPASSSISAIRIAENGATSEGLSTIVQPAASAAATLQEIWLAGQFHGVIMPMTPIGSRRMPVAPCCSSKG